GRNAIETGQASILPKHEITTKLLTNLFTEEEARLMVACFDKCGEAIPAEELAKKAGVSEAELTAAFDDMNDKGKLLKISRNRYLVLPYVPSTSERYFLHRRDDPERMKKVAEAQTALWDLGMLDELNAVGYSGFRVIPSIDPVKRTISLNESLEAENQVMPYEQLEERISKVEPQIFAVIPCPCRTAAELAGKPCQLVDEDFCTVAGKQAGFVIKEGIGREVTKEELLELMRSAEQKGLVHQTSNIQAETTWICNCCPCCCPHLVSRKRYHEAGNTAKSNFLPVIDHEECTLCEECVDLCPMEAMYHHWPHREDGQDEYIRLRPEICIGCGDCASICPTEAIALKKVDNADPVPTYVDMIERTAGKFNH
ncbi:MAG: 4Fe-4S dicluster domain-containing protein, partial [Proteobacteria bacterium]|nr:4Fe-4S dicluster domain-containing protein [Pseudomonadota bacterium]